MKKKLISSCMACLVLLVWSGAASAQDDGKRVIPVELYTCNYNDGQGPDDLDKVIDKWNAWADKKGLDDYSAWTLTPYYYGQEQDFELIWLGAGKDAVALGKAQDTYLNDNDGLIDEFRRVLSCDAHSNFASLNYKAAPENATPGNGVLTFSDCTYKDGASFFALGAAMKAWSQHLSDAGSEAAIFHWYPAYGGGGDDYSFKWIEAHQNLATLGADYESYGNGRGFVTRGRLMGHLVDCDSRRAYIAQNRRFVQLR